MKYIYFLSLLYSYLPVATYQIISPLAERCGPSSANVVCINHYSSVLPGDFYRMPVNASVGPPFGTPYERTNVTGDPSFNLAAEADFIVFDRERGLELLGSAPTNSYMFTTAEAFHDAPVFVPEVNKFYFSQLEPGILAQCVIDLNQEPPVMTSAVATPVIYSAEGGIYHNGLIYYCVGGGNASLDLGSGYVSRPGLYTLNATSGESNVLLNNYFGFYFNGCDDITVDRYGDIWFTDNDYAWGNKVDEVAPMLGTATYRFQPSNGAVTIVEDTLQQPNGIAFSPDGSKLYISDTGVVAPPILQSLGMLGYNLYNTTGKHTIYAFDVIDNGTAISNKRPLYLSKQWLPDGLKVARNGYIVTGAGNGVDILDERGILLVTIKTNYTAVNMNWAGKNFEDLWIVGFGGVSRVTLTLPGPVLSNYSQ